MKKENSPSLDDVKIDPETVETAFNQAIRSIADISYDDIAAFLGIKQAEPAR